MGIYYKSEGESGDYNAEKEENTLVSCREFSEGVPEGLFGLGFGREFSLFVALTHVLTPSPLKRFP